MNKIIEKFGNNSENKNYKKKYYIGYTILFIIAAVFVFSWYFFNERTLIWNADGWMQHYKALVYYGEYLREIVKTLIVDHQFIIPSWDFSIGEGNDILQTFQYYVMGDPFAVFSIMVPTKFMHIYYNFMMIFRLYCAGIAFSALCFGIGRKNRYAIMAGALSYAFCYWGICHATTHPYFLNPMIYFPLMILGVEKILKKERPYLFISSVFVSAVSNFYFFYIIVLLCVIYVAVRLLFIYGKNWKAIGLEVVKIAVAAILGVAMSAIVLLPIMTTFLGDQRMSVENNWQLLYSLGHYSKLPGLVLGQGETYWIYMGFAAPAFVAVCLLCLQKKKYTIYKVFLAISVVFMLLPFFGQVFNGFSYMSNRWSWVIALLVSYIMVVIWPELMELKAKNAKLLLMCIIAYFVLCMLLDYSRGINTITSIGLAVVFLFLIAPISYDGKMLTKRKKQFVAIVLILVSVISTSYYKNASSGGNFAASSVEKNYIVDNLLNNETAIIKNVAEQEDIDGVYRYSGRSLTSNAGILAKISSTQYYWSIANSTVSSFRSKMEMLEEVAYNYKGYDDRSTLLTLAGVRYYVVSVGDGLPLPYGFTYVGTYNLKDARKEALLEQLRKELGVEELSDEQVKIVANSNNQSYNIYRNDNVLPLVYTYENYIEQEKWETLNPIEKQEVMQKSVVLDSYKGKVESSEVELESTTIKPGITCNSENVTQDGNVFVVTQENASITLNFEGLEKSETYIRVKGLDFEGTPVYDLYFGDKKVDPLELYNETNWELLSQSIQDSFRKNKLYWSPSTASYVHLSSSLGVNKSIYYRTEDNAYYNGRHDFTVNLNYSDAAVNSITITFPQVGRYTIDSFEIICQPMEQYASDIEALNQDKVRKLKVETDKVSAVTKFDTTKLMCFSVPYSSGWTAYIDGEETEIYRANDRYMAIEVEEGRHSIVLTYQTPLLKIGFLISFSAFLILLVYIIYYERKKR